MAKKTHKQVNYRRGTTVRKCELCTMFRRVGTRISCTDVADPISPVGVCDIFYRDSKKGARVR